MGDKNQAIIPESHDISKLFRTIASDCKLVIFSGLPGVGKSLYIREFQRIAEEEGKPLDLIQWDVARKAFETEFIDRHFPMQGSTVHNGLKLTAGAWLMDYVKSWIEQNRDTKRLLLIEAPLIGHRFVELVHKNRDRDIELFLESKLCRVIVPIPSARVRRKIEDERRRQVSEDAKDWSGAKPSVMLQLWKDTCEIANEFGMDIDLSEQPPYSQGIYEYVYSMILRHRNFEALIIDEVFDVPKVDEGFLHNADSIQPTEEQADTWAKHVLEHYSSSEIDDIVARWYAT